MIVQANFNDVSFKINFLISTCGIPVSMRVTRTKRCKRLIAFYMKAFAFRHPFQVMVDPEFIQAAVVSKIRLEHGVPELLTGPAKLSTETDVFLTNSDHWMCHSRASKPWGPVLWGAFHVKVLRTYSKLQACSWIGLFA